jgi:hypothetical protein
MQKLAKDLKVGDRIYSTRVLHSHRRNAPVIKKIKDYGTWICVTTDDIGHGLPVAVSFDKDKYTSWKTQGEWATTLEEAINVINQKISSLQELITKYENKTFK